MSGPAALGASFLAALAHPRWWVLALAAFLLRGGILIPLLLVLPLPTTAGLANAVGPTLVGFIFGGPSPSFLVLMASVVAGLLAWLILGGVIAAGLELALVRDAAAEDDFAGVDTRAASSASVAPPWGGDPWRALLLRLIAHIPTALVLAWGAARFVSESYVELVRPGDPALPVAIRIFLRLPDVVVLVLVAGLAGEALGGLAVRHLASGASIPRAAFRALRSLARQGGVAVLIAANGFLGVVLALGSIAISLAYGRARVVLVDGGADRDVGLALGLLSLIWVVTFALIGIAAAWRSVAWTFEVARRSPVSNADVAGD